MRKFRFIGALLLTISLPFSLLSQEGLILLQEIIEKQAKGSELSFELRVSHEEEILQTEGRLLLYGEMFCLQYDALDVRYDSEALSYYDSSENTLTYVSINEDELLMLNPFLLATQSLKANYTLVKHKRDKGIDTIELKAKGKETIYQRIVVTLRRDTATLQAIAVESNDGYSYFVQLLAAKERKGLRKSDFTHPKHRLAESEIIDLR